MRRSKRASPAQRFNLTLDASRSLTIVAHNFNADGSSDVASKAALNGRPIDMQQDAFVRHGELTALANNVLEFWMD